MSWITLTYYPTTGSPVEKTVADWGITECEREAMNQAQDALTLNMAGIAADSDDIFPFGSKIAIQIGRVGTIPAGYTQPVSFTGGSYLFIGWRINRRRDYHGTNR